jgi:hypothetical protein
MSMSMNMDGEDEYECKEVAEEARPLPFGVVSDAELFDPGGFEFTVGVFLQGEEDKLEELPPVVETVGVDRPAIRRCASQCSSSHSSPFESGFSQPVAFLTASSNISPPSPPASQMENPRNPSDLMKDPLAVNARGES